MKKITLIFTVLYFGYSFANDSNQAACHNLGIFFPFKAGVKAEKLGAHTEAFNIYCNLAFKGDYRAQFKLAKYYSEGIEGYLKINKTYSWVWSKLSNYYIVSRKREEFIEQLETEFDKDDLDRARKLYYKALHSIPGGVRIDMKYKEIDLEKLLEEYNKKKEYTGSRVKRKRPSLGLGIIQVN